MDTTTDTIPGVASFNHSEARAEYERRTESASTASGARAACSVAQLLRNQFYLGAATLSAAAACAISLATGSGRET
jgi:hypothetical protein